MLGFASGEEAKYGPGPCTVSRDIMPEQEKAVGYVRTPVFHDLIRSQCEYCGVILISVQATLEELERKHRMLCKRARAAAAGS